jgi:hypothetical protein
MIECPPGFTHQQIIDRITKPLIVHINGFCKDIQDSVNKILQSWNYPKEHKYTIQFIDIITLLNSKPVSLIKGESSKRKKKPSKKKMPTKKKMPSKKKNL